VRSRFLITSASILLIAGCHASSPGDDGKEYPDAGEPTIDSPQVDAPAETPLGSVALRGSTSDATRVVVKQSGSTASQVASLLPGGNFCIDAPLAASGPTHFEVYAVAEDGRISAPTEVAVTQNPSALEPEQATCTEGDCATAEICDNQQDDDCDGLEDACDPGCNGCTDDFLEPNDTPFGVPILASGSYHELQICPCRDDWYALSLGEGERVDATIQFVASAIDIDLKLFKAADAEQDDGAPVAQSAGIESSEEIDYTATTAGVYYLRVYAYQAEEANGSYALELTY
jgi:hypothetical protein